MEVGTLLARGDGGHGRLADSLDPGVALARPRAAGSRPGGGAPVAHPAHGLSVSQSARVPADPFLLLPAPGQGARLGAAPEPAEGISESALASSSVLRR